MSRVSPSPVTPLTQDCIHILRGSGVKPPRNRHGPTINIVIDVLRAFTTAEIVFSNGASKIYLAKDAAEALAMKRKDSSLVLIGERKSSPIEGFDYNNSPALLALENLRDMRIVMKTSNGTVAAQNSMKADFVFVTGLSLAESLAQHLHSLVSTFNSTPRINLVASHPEDDDDLACADYLRARLLCLSKPDWSMTVQRVRESDHGKAFLDPDHPELDPADIDYCTRRAKGDFVLEVHMQNGQSVVSMKPILAA